MAQSSLNIYLNSNDKDNLAEVLKGVIENIQAGCVSEVIKAKNGSGTPEAGVIHYKRLQNATLNNYGTARTASAGVAVKDADVAVNIDTDKEIVEEIEGKDINLFGIPDLVGKRAYNHAQRIKAFLDKTFFSVAKTAGTAYAGSKTAYDEVLDEMIVSAKNTASNYIDGIEAEDLCIVLDGLARKAVKSALDELPQGTKPENGLIGMYDSIEVHESNRMPAGTHIMVMLKGAVAQPWYVTDYEAEKIPLTDAVAVESFLHCGTKALVSEAIYYFADSTSI